MCHVLGIGQLVVLAPLCVVEEMSVFGSLLECRRHQVVPPFPLLSVVRQLLGPFVDGRELAVLAGPRDPVNEDGAEYGADGDVERGLYYQSASLVVFLPAEVGVDGRFQASS